VILPDVNLLIHAYDSSGRHHERAKAWWEGVLAGEETVGLAWATILGFIRLTTNRVVFQHPLPVHEAVEHVKGWLEQPNVRILHPGHRHPELCFGFLLAAGAGGNLTTDAHLAALAIEHACVLYSTDADFARFAGIMTQNPVASR
jgi:uncharacterized protein